MGWRVYPLHPLETNVSRLWAMCERVRCILLRQWETEPFGMDVSLPAMPRFGGFRSLFARSIKAQDKGPQSLMRAARPQSPAVRGFFRETQTAVGLAVLQNNRSRSSGKVPCLQGFAAILTDVTERKEEKLDDNKKSTTIWLRPKRDQPHGWLAGSRQLSKPQ